MVRIPAEVRPLELMIAENAIVGGRYRVSKLVGGGGMKLVYLAEDLRLAARQCALAEMVDTFTSPEMQQQAVTAFQREADMLAQLANEHIPRVFDRFSEQNHHYLVMEYIDGATLDQTLEKAGGKLDELRVINIALQILETLEYLHNLEPPVIYRDLKPSNVMLTAAGQVKLIDFGIARHFQPLSNATMIGTQGYAPPEQYRGKVEIRSDLYALGATMHHALSGRDPSSEPPFSFPPLRTLCPNLRPGLGELIDKTLSYDVENRIVNAAEFKRQLLQIKTGVAISPAASGPDGRAPKIELSTPISGSTAPDAAPTMLVNDAQVECLNCKRKVPADSRFCSFCATDLRRVLKSSEVISTPDAETSILGNSGNPQIGDPTGIPRSRGRDAHHARRRTRRAIVIFLAIFIVSYSLVRLASYLSEASGPTVSRPINPGAPPVPRAPGDYGYVPPRSESYTSSRAAALRLALNTEGYSSVHFQIDGDSIVLWGTVPTDLDRANVQLLVVTVTGIYSLDDHLKVTGGMGGP